MSKLYKSNDDIVVAGVLGGIGEYLKISPDIVRVAYVIIALFSGSLFMMAALYALAVFLIPKRSPDEFEANYTYSDSQGANNGNTFTSENFKKSFHDFGNEMKTKKNSILEGKNSKLIGYILIAAGVYLSLSKILYVVRFDGSLAPIMLIILGLVVLFRNDRRKKSE